MSTQPRSSKLMALVAGLCSLVIATAELTGPHTYAVEYCFGKQAYRAMCSSVVLVGGSSHSFSLVAESRESFYILRIEPARRLGPIRCRPARGLGGAVPDCAILDSQSTVPGEYVYEVAAVKALPTSTVISPTSDLAWEAANACCSIIWTSAGKVTFPEKDWIDDEAEVTMLCGPGEDASALIPVWT
ncbi:uncharacterized protein L969DRAFT_93203 [Mixia osmundae IAM 14324]|uniref:Uncharacterized protein n=1 Tax=Mixia osmundae (strain CBS 9802 / IAM 14324 / JCM 22182 / KY 12970) TaxID=764103 RepID=G7E5S9_MIXOS|nr:uncharacterized protein L969DRAFT_93203 [Mixia osmundae IAM 14324]KEI40660.1 hypothetical protein L969DRAFT_93203 [Mixia osmundae IAM 14324]GAA98189.1 hypothetical protein E5Q_04872 [Mixia osmundae IAM 14324]